MSFVKSTVDSCKNIWGKPETNIKAAHPLKEWENDMSKSHRGELSHRNALWEMRDERCKHLITVKRKKKEKPNTTNVTKDSYYVILAAKYHSLDNLWILTADMDDTNEKGGTMLCTRNSECLRRELQHMVEGGNLAKRVLCVLRGVSLKGAIGRWLETKQQHTDSWLCDRKIWLKPETEKRLQWLQETPMCV